MAFWQGDRTQKVGVVDREYIVHKGIQSLGGAGSSAKKVSFNGRISMHFRLLPLRLIHSYEIIRIIAIV